MVVTRTDFDPDRAAIEAGINELYERDWYAGGMRPLEIHIATGNQTGTGNVATWQGYALPWTNGAIYHARFEFKLTSGGAGNAGLRYSAGSTLVVGSTVAVVSTSWTFVELELALTWNTDISLRSWFTWGLDVNVSSGAIDYRAVDSLNTWWRRV